MPQIPNVHVHWEGFMDDMIEVTNAALVRGGSGGDSLEFGAGKRRDGLPSEEGLEEGTPWQGGTRSTATPVLWGAAQFLLDQVPVGVALMDGSMRVAVTNRALDARIHAQDGVMLRDEMFVLTDAQAHKQLSECIAKAESGEDSGPVKFAVRARRPASRPDLHLLVTCVRGGHWCIWVFDPLGSRELSTTVLRDLHGLTEAEAKVASALFTGCSTKEAAATLGISVNTVKAHLKGIFRKCGVRSQAELSQLLALGCWNI
jgi:DNA-binding CsgD family transcriptional regulator